jgi:hydrogenase maturation factor
MCYAIPGSVKEISEDSVSIDYFGEERKARNVFYDLQIGDYVYAQGGFVVQKIDVKLAGKILDTHIKFITLKMLFRREPIVIS